LSKAAAHLAADEIETLSGRGRKAADKIHVQRAVQHDRARYGQPVVGIRPQFVIQYGTRGCQHKVAAQVQDAQRITRCEGSTCVHRNAREISRAAKGAAAVDRYRADDGAVDDERALVDRRGAGVGIAGGQQQSTAADLHQRTCIADFPSVSCIRIIAARRQRAAAQVDRGVAAHRADVQSKECEVEAAWKRKRHPAGNRGLEPEGVGRGAGDGRVGRQVQDVHNVARGAAVGVAAGKEDFVPCGCGRLGLERLRQRRYRRYVARERLQGGERRRRCRPGKGYPLRD
jgi:hypothetical protein